jgi:hypothetical protein
VTSLIGFTFLPVARFFCCVYSPTAPTAHSLKPLLQAGYVIRCESVQVYHHHLPVGAAKSAQCTHMYGSYTVCHLFFSFGGGRPLHNVQSLIFSLMDVPTICIVTSSSTVFLKILPSVVLLPRHGSCLLLHHMMPLPVVLSFLRCSCSLTSRSLIPLGVPVVPSRTYVL